MKTNFSEDQEYLRFKNELKDLTGYEIPYDEYLKYLEYKNQDLGNCCYCGGKIQRMNGQDGRGEYCTDCGYCKKNYDEDYSNDCD